ncbi:MAG TPA: hypothetical protein H9943_08265 [Candidatus Ruthenibacterium avium]|uniref:Uncharacterized protein n=1 Tax=Candidatus Ruthenibacterium avium TaxID=2838751 RepID=A0A9D2M3Y0_9FIRM|nr:hypothetical protein [Candidatus Ruthenibacterium avium]
MEKEKKIRIPLWIMPSTNLRVKQAVERHGFKSPSEFIETAVLNYLGQMAAEENLDYFTQTISSVMEGIQSVSESRLRRVMYKQAVELAMMENILVNLGNYSPADIHALRGKVVKDVNRLKGNYDFDAAAQYQSGSTDETDTL